MRKTRILKIASVAAASAVLLVSTYGCSVMKARYSDVEKAVQAIEGDGAFVQLGEMHPVEDVEFAYAGDTAVATEIEEAGLPGAVSGAVSGAIEEGGAWLQGRGAAAGGYEENMEEYRGFGVTYEPVNGYWWFDGKPVAAVRDENHYTMTDGRMIEVGALLLVTRDGNDNITDVSAVDRETFAAEAGLAFEGGLEREAQAQGYEYHEERVRIQGLSAKEFNDTVNGLAAKYRHTNAAVKLDDYVLWLHKDDMLHLSSFCYSDHNAYGVKVYADYDVADEMDLRELDSVAVDKLLLDMLSQNTYETTRDVEDAAKRAVAAHYGVDAKYLSAMASLV